MKKRYNIKGFLGLVAGVVVFVVCAYVSKALTESGTRTALASWMKGDAVVQNPFAAVLDFVVENSVTVVDTFADLASVNGAKRVDGSVVLTRGNQSATGSGGGAYYYSSTSSASTNLHSSIANTSGGRFLSLGPAWIVATQGWDPDSVTNGTATSLVFTNFGTLPPPVAGDLVLVSHSGVVAANTNLVITAQATTTSNVVVTVASASGTINVATGLVRIAYWKQ